MPHGDNWKHRSQEMSCAKCMWYVPKVMLVPNFETLEEVSITVSIGRCRRHAPAMSGWPVVHARDWCGDHKLDETKL